jgi:hypothetical protein
MIRTERKRILGLFGDFCRETAVLVFVFGNLDLWLRSLPGSSYGTSISPQDTALNVGTVMGLTMFLEQLVLY